MKHRIRRGVLIVFIAGSSMLLGIRYLAAQHQNPVRLTRLYTGADGLTHAEETTMSLVPNTALAGTQRSDPVAVNRMQILRWPPGTVNEWHNASQTPGGHQYVITLSGRGQVELSDEHKITLDPERMVLAEDLTGKGHITRTIGSDDWVSVHVSIADR